MFVLFAAHVEMTLIYVLSSPVNLVDSSLISMAMQEQQQIQSSQPPISQPQLIGIEAIKALRR